MEEVLSFLTANPLGCLATVGADGGPAVRPFQFMLAKDSLPYFCTGRGKRVHRDMEQDARVEFCSTAPDGSWLRLRGRAAFVEDDKLRHDIVASCELVRSIYGSGDNPNLLVFTLDGLEAVIADVNGSPARTFRAERR